MVILHIRKILWEPLRRQALRNQFGMYLNRFFNFFNKSPTPAALTKVKVWPRFDFFIQEEFMFCSCVSGMSPWSLSTASNLASSWTSTALPSCRK